MSEIEGSVSERRSEWRPEQPAGFAPIFVWPPQPKAFGKFLFTWGGFLWPWQVIYLGLAIVSWEWLQLDLDRSRDFRFDWIATIYLRNMVILWVFAGGWHLVLYILKWQGSDRKYDPRWPFVGRRTFLFNSQVRDNVFWSCISGVAVWSAWEVILVYGYANGWLPYLSWSDNPTLFVLLFLAVPFWRELHFYFTHRLLHWAPIYRRVHALHHKNTNPGPWSGLAMHPIEHIVYFSTLAIHFVVPTHPFHMMFHATETALTPSQGHTGFDGNVLGGKLPTGSYFHWLHHRYFECNYGEAGIPLDRWFGTFRDGSDEGEGATRPTEHQYEVEGEDPYLLRSTSAPSE